MLRALSLAISIRHERQLQRVAAEEYGRTNSAILGILHGLIYATCLGEVVFFQSSLPHWDWINSLGVCLLVFGLICLFWVIHTLGTLWTVKLYIAPNHQLNTNAVFRIVRHPNYFLNIIPELVGLVLVSRAWITGAVLLPMYLVSLAVRIAQEERIMRKTFPHYAKMRPSRDTGILARHAPPPN